MRVFATSYRSAASRNPAESPIAPTTPDDQLLACLAYVARQRGIPFSAEAVMASLPQEADGRLTPVLFERAAARLGFKARVMARRPSQVPAMVAPFVVLFSNGDAGVITGKAAGSRTCSLVMPFLSDATRHNIRLRDLDAASSGFVIYVAPQDVPTGVDGADQRAPSGGHWFWREAISFWPAWLQMVVAALVINILGLAFPLFVMNVYDRVIPNAAMPTLWALTAGVCIAVVFDFLMRQLRAVALDDLGRRIDLAVSSRIFEQALSITMAARRADTGSMANSVREFETVRDFFTSSSILAITDLLFIVIFLAVLWIIVGPLAYVPMLAVPLVLLLALAVQAPLKRSVEQTQNVGTRRHSTLVEALGAIETVKAVGGERVLQRRWEDASAAQARSLTATRSWSSLAIYLTSAIQQASSVLLLVWGVFLVTDGQTTVGALVAAMLLSGRALAPLGNVAMTLARAQTAFAGMRAISAMMALPEDRPPRVRSAETITAGGIVFDELSFTYPQARGPALKNVSFRIAAGERVGIIGRVGSGKTTIGKLLAGLYGTETGSILIDDVDIARYDPAELRRQVGFVSQEAELLGGTVGENIILGRPEASQAEIAEAARAAGVDEFIAAHPLGLNLPVGERGRGLSGGQRQAVALARMLLRDPKILFLDEPSSAMDAETEARLVERLAEWVSAHAATLLVCSHRTSFLKLVDRVLVVDGGRLIADGPKLEVLNRLSGGPPKVEVVR